ncbi:protein crooked neck-like [Limanda limanda]|uniref:protein crooked neck-like n=1 Tax=Limanda limanda TaxID=27771 RepID=UPI0029C7F859|nr:protein crooked neck-like [Limanda limanda]
MEKSNRSYLTSPVLPHGKVDSLVDLFVRVSNQVAVNMYKHLGCSVYRTANPHNYDAWLDYLHLLDSDDPDTVRRGGGGGYDRAITITPPIQEKRYWRRYIYLWINYTLYEEREVKGYIKLQMPDIEKMIKRELEQQRSLYEAQLAHENTESDLWRRYAEYEMDNGQKVKAKSIWRRAISIRPDFQLFWYEYNLIYSEESNIPECRKVFEEWMATGPGEQAWRFFIENELRHREVALARSLYERFVIVHPKGKNLLDFALFEEKNGNITHSREVFERALQCVQISRDPEFFMAYIHFEEDQKQFERVLNTYDLAFSRTRVLLENFTIFRKNFGDQRVIEDYFTRTNPRNYDAWLAYLHVLYNHDEPETFTFAKIWLLYAKFEIEQNNMHVAEEALDLLESLVRFENDRGGPKGLYREWLDHHNHVKVRIGFANTKGKLYGSTRLSRCRERFKEAHQSLRTCAEEDRIKLLNAWYFFERENGSETTENHVLAKMPQQERRMRRLVDEDGEERSEEYTDFTFPEETAEQHQD